MKSLFLSLFSVGLLFFSCKKYDKPHVGTYQPDVANAWMQMQIRLTKTTAGYNSIVSLRSFGYAGVTMYESLFPESRGCRSIITETRGTAVISDRRSSHFYPPASVNAAMAMITRKFFESTSPANKLSIDSLERALNHTFQGKSTKQQIDNGIIYGQKVAAAIFEISKIDGGHQAYLHVVDPSYDLPIGKGLWVPTPPAFAAPIHPQWGDNRSFLPYSAVLTQPGPPLTYDESEKSAFYQMVKQLYTISQSLSKEDSVITRFWGDLPGNMNVPAHATNIVRQLINSSCMDLYDAAAVYAMHGIALNEAGISVMKAKYKYNLLRPVTYIRTVMQKPLWNSVIPTPPHPEYPAAHAVVSAASATVLEGIFGKHYKFSDHSYDDVYGTRHFDSFDDYAREASRSRLLAGIHYAPSIETGLIQGERVGKLVNKLKPGLFPTLKQ